MPTRVQERLRRRSDPTGRVRLSTARVRRATRKVFEAEKTRFKLPKRLRLTFKPDIIAAGRFFPESQVINIQPRTVRRAGAGGLQQSLEILRHEVAHAVQGERSERKRKFRTPSTVHGAGFKQAQRRVLRGHPSEKKTRAEGVSSLSEMSRLVAEFRRRKKVG